MNIFYLDQDIKKCVEYHCDKHIVKMITETAQLLNSAYYFTGEQHKAQYKLSHVNHPCTKWARESLSNWLWLRDFGLALYDEYKYRYNNRDHKAGDIILMLESPKLTDKGLTTRPQVMPIQYKDIDIIKAYRTYYICDKQHILKYTKRGLPEWLTALGSVACI